MNPQQRDRFHLFIGGESQPASTDEWFESTDPATGETIAEVARATPSDVDRAVRTAADAFETWRDLPGVERGRILSDVATAVKDRADQLAELESLDQGKPLSQAKSDVETTARYFEYYAGIADKLEGKSVPLSGSNVDFTERVPYGVSAQIAPWNVPVSLAARGSAPALAAGNTVVVKPASPTPLATAFFAEICYEAGVPDGVFNVVTGRSDSGAALSSHAAVDVITFTGSVPTGQTVMEAAAETVTPVTLELGGKNSAIVMADADLDRAISEIDVGIFWNAGQICAAADRALVHESLYEEFVDGIVDAAESYELGHGLEDPDMGPLNNEDHYDEVLRYLDLGVEEGATLETGGRPLERDGYFVEPTVFSDVDPDMRIAQEEIFGPVLTVIPFSDADEAIEMANDVEFGLTGGIFSQNVDRALTAARGLDVGSVYVNEWYGGGVEAPFGGTKLSGIGREKGLEALDSYLQTKNISINLDRGI
ncbi:aldehyde dehydrogenase family protein [Natrarchaeobius oligotrophus]|uniref:Aldehyde dehydrogenase family protein n=1 Tax=Natrarchaeobius chitinivorans TaxID=1679083 RepID=A0A3N6MX45_NATCH|nr:aldehyde dehydrogenase family protein [Natrarchaeobius chitinivorans]RQH02581.1 aldehyde dehydrogenase family protein [Natrarchaeobius chitinivorans]